jgi:FHS family L-fucose permease-like MFS transporter
MMGNMMNFAAYFFMGIPAGRMLTTIGYKRTALIALAIGFIGLVVQYLSSIVGANIALFNVNGQAVALNLIIYLLGAFICGFCVCMLNTVVNPMLNILGGGGNKGNQLVQTGGSLNSLTGTLTPLLVGVLVGTVTSQTSMSNVAPLLFIGMAVFALAFFIISFVNVPEPALHRARSGRTRYEHSAWNFRHFVLGAIAIFFYVGLEVGIPNEMLFYINSLGFEGSATIAGFLAATYWFLMLIGRFVGAAIGGHVSSKSMLTATTSIAAILVLCAILLPQTMVNMPVFKSDISFGIAEVPVNILLLILCGLCTSVMWGAIFNLAVEGLGKHTAAASGIFMMMVCGGGVLPLIQGWIADNFGFINSYFVVFAGIIYMLIYAIAGSKIKR